MIKRQDKQGKDPAAVALGRKGGKARLTTMTPERRTELARHAGLSRYGRAVPPAKSYQVVLIPMPEELHGGVNAITTILDDSHAKPEVILWTRDREEARARAREVNLEDDPVKCAEVIEVAYDLTRFTIQREYKPDTEAQLAALKVLTNEEGRS